MVPRVILSAPCRVALPPAPLAAPKFKPRSGFFLCGSALLDLNSKGRGRCRPVSSHRCRRLGRSLSAVGTGNGSRRFLSPKRYIPKRLTSCSVCGWPCSMSFILAPVGHRGRTERNERSGCVALSGRSVVFFIITRCLATCPRIAPVPRNASRRWINGSNFLRSAGCLASTPSLSSTASRRMCPSIARRVARLTARNGWKRGGHGLGAAQTFNRPLPDCARRTAWIFGERCFA